MYRNFIKCWLSSKTEDGTLILLQLPVLSGSLKATDCEKDKAAKENDKEKDKKPATENEVVIIYWIQMESGGRRGKFSLCSEDFLFYPESNVNGARLCGVHFPLYIPSQIYKDTSTLIKSNIMQFWVLVNIKELCI